MRKIWSETCLVDGRVYKGGEIVDENKQGVRSYINDYPNSISLEQELEVLEQVEYKSKEYKKKPKKSQRGDI